MALETLIAVRVLEGLGLIVGLSVVYFAVKAYRRTQRGPMMILAVAFMLITAGSLVEGFMFEVLQFGFIDAHIFMSALKLGGLSAVLYAIRKA